MVKTIEGSNAAPQKIRAVPDTEKSMQEIAFHISLIQEIKIDRDKNIQDACGGNIEEIEKNIQSFKTEIKNLKSRREFLLAQLYEQKLLQHIEAKKILMNKSLAEKSII